MKLIERFRAWRETRASLSIEEPVEGQIEEPPLGEDEDPFPDPVELEIRDVIDLHSIPPRQVKAVVEEYLLAARDRGYSRVRIIHGKGVGVQREIVRSILDRTDFVVHYTDAPGLGSTLAEFALTKDRETRVR
jgi:dsDNA-specific endonuclease/ATPase MutS2